MQIYSVGGAIRDALLGRLVVDRDYVVVGATPELMLAQGFKPVGRDFPVFLHPQTHEEYALARTERKTGPGYHGFQFHAAPEVTLEEDLARRDLTINAMAQGEDGVLVDPFSGRADLAARLLRHVGPAFVEDPVRVLRLARFAARLGDFSVAPETLALMQDMVASGELDHLTPERVWQEIAKGLMETRPSRMLAVLRQCGALARLMPEADALFGVPERIDYHPEGNSGAHLLLVLDAAAAMRLPLPARFAALAHDLGKGLTPPAEWPRHRGHEAKGEALLLALCARLKVPTECRDLARLTVLEHTHIHCAGLGAEALTPASMTRLMERCDLHRRPARFQWLLQACEADHRGRLGRAHLPYPPASLWQAAAVAFRAVDGGKIARDCASKNTPAQKIPERLHEARVAAVREVMARLRAAAQ
ncbi:MAG: multifunctional CCA addition/repair protein [Zoogloeaceae bacterium]|nr:multifunctional CCA addition/repair protein [Zoogloeaceae bacterium]